MLWELFTSGWPPDTRDPSLAPQLAAVYAKATDRDPDCRYQSVRDLREAFELASRTLGPGSSLN